MFGHTDWRTGDLGQKFDDLLGMAWTMAETMGKSLTQAADNLNTVNNNYLVTERTVAGGRSAIGSRRPSSQRPTTARIRSCSSSCSRNRPNARRTSRPS